VDSKVKSGDSLSKEN